MAASKGPTAPEATAVCIPARCATGTRTHAHARLKSQQKCLVLSLYILLDMKERKKVLLPTTKIFLFFEERHSSVVTRCADAPLAQNLPKWL